jgi:hypothetical protein
MVEPNIQASQGDAQDFSSRDHWGEIPQVAKLREDIRKLKDAEAAPRRWDTLDIQQLMEAALDGFAQEFYRVPFDEMKDRDIKRIVGAIAAHCIELGRACSPIPYVLTESGRAAAQAPAAASQPGRPHALHTPPACSVGGVRCGR